MLNGSNIAGTYLRKEKKNEKGPFAHSTAVVYIIMIIIIIIIVIVQITSMTLSLVL